MTSVGEIRATNDRKISKQWIGKDVEGNYSGLISGAIPLREPMRNLSQDSRPLGPDLNPGLPK
jgi:hypothetical protein